MVLSEEYSAFIKLSLYGFYGARLFHVAMVNANCIPFVLFPLNMGGEGGAFDIFFLLVVASLVMTSFKLHRFIMETAPCETDHFNPQL